MAKDRGKGNKPRLTVVSNLSQSLKKSLLTTEEEVQEVKTSHRRSVNILIDDYMSKVLNGEVEGIRHAKDLVELIKADLLLLGEATDRTENLSELEQTKVARIQEEIDIEDPAVLALVDKLTQALNGVNDDADN